MSNRVDMMDGRCRTCGSQLEIIDGSDETLMVKCIECDDSYELEPDAVGIDYYVAFMANRMDGGDG